MVRDVDLGLFELQKEYFSMCNFKNQDGSEMPEKDVINFRAQGPLTCSKTMHTPEDTEHVSVS